MSQLLRSSLLFRLAAIASTIFVPSSSSAKAGSLKKLALGCINGREESCALMISGLKSGKWGDKNIVRISNVLKKRCDSGNPVACEKVGYLYARGFGLEKNPYKAAHYLKKACEADNALGCSRLGATIQFGTSGVVSKSALLGAYRYYEKACKLGNLTGCLNQASMLLDGQGVGKDEERAKKIYEDACEKGEHHACYSLGIVYYDGRGVKKDWIEASKYLKKACSNGVSESCELYYTVRGKYVGHLGHPGHQRLLKSCLEGSVQSCLDISAEAVRPKIRGIPLGDLLQVFEYFCHDEILLACDRYAYFLILNGSRSIGLADDIVKADGILKKLCDSGNSMSCDNLGVMRVRGFNGKSDPIAARKRFKQGCDGGYAPSCVNLCYMVHRGLGGSRDPYLARDLCSRGGFLLDPSKADIEFR